ncbi:MAG: hypothetical protein F7B78_01385 [Desulfurococcales archaeon]|nr:hypothetical protein [Desulfurococcales archaeon]
MKANGKLLVALVIAFALGAVTTAYLINPGGYLSYQVITISKTNFTTVPFNINLGQIPNGTIGSASTSFVLDTTPSTGSSDYTFRLVNNSQLTDMQTFYLVMNVSGTTVSLGYDIFTLRLM